VSHQRCLHDIQSQVSGIQSQVPGMQSQVLSMQSQVPGMQSQVFWADSDQRQNSRLKYPAFVPDLGSWIMKILKRKSLLFHGKLRCLGDRIYIIFQNDIRAPPQEMSGGSGLYLVGTKYVIAIWHHRSR
jgi:hypothetical protein